MSVSDQCESVRISVHVSPQKTETTVTILRVGINSGKTIVSIVIFARYVVIRSILCLGLESSFTAENPDLSCF